MTETYEQVRARYREVWEPYNRLDRELSDFYRQPDWREREADGEVARLRAARTAAWAAGMAWQDLRDKTYRREATIKATVGAAFDRRLQELLESL